jgi:hypothetical protein
LNSSGSRGLGAELETVNIDRHKFHPEWNYVIKPHTH